MSARSWARWAAVSAAGAAACALALLAGAWVSSTGAPAELTVPSVSPTAVRFETAQDAASALLPDYFRTIPLSSFGGAAAGLAPGVRLAVQTESGKELTGTVVAVRKSDVVMRVESWKSAAPARR